VNAATCAEIWLVPVFSDAAKHPTVFKKDLDNLGLGKNVMKYVKLHTEDKEIVAAREYFSSRDLLPWLSSSRGDGSMNVVFSMIDEFGETPTTILTAHIVILDGKLEISCTNMAGDTLCYLELQGDDNVAKLGSVLREKLNWGGAVFWYESEKVLESSLLSGYSVLTVGEIASLDHICGSYQSYTTGCHPAGYSASGTSSAHILNLEPGRASLQHYFKGDYKRAEELLSMKMSDASWTIESSDDGKRVVRVAGRAELSRFWVHERSGPEGTSLRDYECFALVKIPVEELERVQQSETFHHTSTTGSGWTCGSEDYRCNFFLPLCLVETIREASFDALGFLKRSLIVDGKQAHGRRYRDNVLRLSSEQFEMIKHFRLNLIGATSVSVSDLIELQATGLKELQATVTQES